MTYYIGIDGGGTKTLLRVKDETGAVCYEDVGGGSNPYTVPPAEATALVSAMVKKAMAAMGDNTLGGICMGASGADTEEDYALFDRALREASGSDLVRVVNDGYASLYAVLGDKPGVVVASGTGSICWGKNEAGEIIRVGGWGYLFSDEGSGYCMVKDALKTVCQTIDGRASRGTLLLEKLMDAFGVETPLDLVSEIYRCPSPQFIAGYFPLVSKAAEENDPLAIEVIDKGMEDLVELAASAARQLGMYPAFTVGMTGSILNKVAMTREVFMKKAIERFPRCTVVDTLAENVEGALFLAQRIEG